MGLRGALYYAFIWIWWETLRLVPLGNAVTVVKLECFVIGLLSSLCFGEQLSRRWWLCAFTALFGVVLVAQPPVIFGQDSSGISVSGMCLNVLACCAASAVQLVIKMAPGAHFLEVQHTTDFISGVVCTVPVMLYFGDPSEFMKTEVQEAVLSVAVIGI